VGAIILVAPGAEVRPGEGIVELHYRRERDLDAATPLVQQAIEISDEAPGLGPLVIDEIPA
jgi:hypothetical protein